MKGSFVKRSVLAVTRKRNTNHKTNNVLRNRLKNKLVGINRESNIKDLPTLAFPAKSTIKDSPDPVRELANKIYESKGDEYFKSEYSLFNIENILFKLHLADFNIDLIPHCFDQNGLYNLPIISGENISYKDWVRFNENSIIDFRRLVEFLELKDSVKGFRTHLYLSAYLEGLEDIEDLELNLDTILELASTNLSLWLFDAPSSVKEEFRQRTDSLIQDLDLIVLLGNAIDYHTLGYPLNANKDTWIEIRNMLLG